MTDYKKQNRITGIVRKILGITTIKTGSKQKVMESHGFYRDPEPKVLQPHVKSKHEKAIKKAVADICAKRKEMLGEYHINEDIFDKLIEVFEGYNGKISTVTAVGILDLVKDELKR